MSDWAIFLFVEHKSSGTHEMFWTGVLRPALEKSFDRNRYLFDDAQMAFLNEFAQDIQDRQFIDKLEKQKLNVTTRQGDRLKRSADQYERALQVAKKRKSPFLQSVTV